MLLGVLCAAPALAQTSAVSDPAPSATDAAPQPSASRSAAPQGTAGQSPATEATAPRDSGSQPAAAAATPADVSPSEEPIRSATTEPAAASPEATPAATADAAKDAPADPAAPAASDAGVAIPAAAAAAAVARQAEEPVAGNARVTEDDTPLAIGVLDDAPPFSAMERFGGRVGFDIDVAFALCARLERSCRLVPLSRTALAQGLRDRRLDAVIASDGRVEGLAAYAVLSDPYVVLAARFVVPKGEGSDLEGGDNRPYGAVIGTPYATYLQETYGQSGVALYSESEAMWIDLAMSRLAGVLTTAVAARTEFISTPLGSDFRLSNTALNDSSVKAQVAAVAVRKDEASLLTAFNAALADYMNSPDYTEALNRHLSGGLATRPNAKTDS